MRNRMVLIIFTAILLLASACKAEVLSALDTPKTPADLVSKATHAPTPTPAPTPTLTPVPTPKATPMDYNADAFRPIDDEYIEYIYPDENEVTVTENDITSLNANIDIPLYIPDHIAIGAYGGFTPTLDHGMWLSWSNYTDYLQYILDIYPSNAWRKIADDKYYVMYDLTDGTRIYVFFASLDNDARVLGYPILMKDSLSYSKFSNISIGDTLEEVKSVDYIAKYTCDLWNPATEQGIANFTNAGNPPCSVHLLTDGILKYTYERSGEEGNYVYTIIDIEYHEDFKMEGFGGVTDYSIAEVDYVD